MFKSFLDFIQGNPEKARNLDDEISVVKGILENYQNENLEVSDQLLRYLCDLTKFSCDEVELPIITCHIISNLALDENYAVIMIQLGVIRNLTKLLAKHNKNSKLVWKCTSAIWNLCRPVDIEDYIPVTLPGLVFECLVTNLDFKKAVHTSFGALSNLALVKPAETGNIFTEKNMEIMAVIVKKYRNVNMIAGHFGAMVANIAVNAQVANKFVNNNFIEILFQCLQETTERSSVKHLVAAVHNMSDIQSFCDYLCEAQGVELLRKIQIDYNDEISEFVNGIFDLSSLPQSATTSLHASVVSCDISMTIDLLKRFGKLETKDLEGKTALQLAIDSDKYETVQLLVASGAEGKHCVLKEGGEGKSMKRYIDHGTELRFESIQMLKNMVLFSQPKANVDICSVINACIPGVELLLILQNEISSKT